MEFVVLWNGGAESIIEVWHPDDLDAACAELFGGETIFIDMVYRNATDDEAYCPKAGLSHEDNWWAGYACRDCGRP